MGGVEVSPSEYVLCDSRKCTGRSRHQKPSQEHEYFQNWGFLLTLRKGERFKGSPERLRGALWSMGEENFSERGLSLSLPHI